MNQRRLILSKKREGTFGTNTNGQTTITFKRTLNHSIERVWRAITDADELRAWFPMLTLEAKDGGSVVMDFNGGDCPPNELNPDDIDYCTVTAFDPPYLLEYLGPTGGIRWELTPRGDLCELVMTATNHPGQDIIYSIVCGWHHIVDCLEWLLDGVDIEAEGYAGPVKMKIYQHYIDEKVPGFTG